MKTIAKVLKTVDWFFALSAGLTYLLGAVMAVESGRAWNVPIFLAGFFFLLGIYLLERVYFYLSSSKINLFSSVSRSKKLQAPEMAGLVFVLFALLAFLLYFLSQNSALGGQAWLWLLLITILLMVNTARGWRIWSAAFRDFMDALIISPLILFFSSAVQGSPAGGVLFALSIPLMLIYLASRLAMRFETYADDLAGGAKSYLGLVGWERGLSHLYDIVLLGYLSLGAYLYVSGAWSLAWPALLVVIISGAEALLLHRMSAGMRPNWPLIRALAALQFAGLVYMLLFAFLSN